MGKYLSTLRTPQGYEKHEINEKAVQDAKTHAHHTTKKEQSLKAVPTPQSNFVTPRAVEMPSSTAFSSNSSNSFNEKKHSHRKVEHLSRLRKTMT